LREDSYCSEEAVTLDLAAGLTNLESLAAHDGLWAEHLRYRNRTSKTVRNYLQAVAQLAAYRADQGLSLDAGDVTTGELEAFLAHVRTRTSAATAATRYRQLRPFFRHLAEEIELIDASPMTRMAAITVEERMVPVPEGEHVAAILRNCERDKSFEGRRDLAILRMFITSGARLREVTDIELEDIGRGARSIRVLGRVSVNATSSWRTRLIPLCCDT
jgi:site-specific recombinase XerD